MHKFLVPLSILSILLALTVDSHARDNHLHPPHSPNSANPRQLSVECEKAGDPCGKKLLSNSCKALASSRHIINLNLSPLLNPR